MDSENQYEEEESPLEFMFSRASKHFASIASSLPSDDLLYFYSRYKQASEGDCVGSRPSLFSMTARRKYDAWKQLTGTDRSKAMEEYIAGVKDKDPEWNGEASGSWARVSRMPAPADNEETNDSNNIFLDAVKGGCESTLSDMPRIKEYVISHFEDGMTGLHWACDRGHEEVAELLLQRGALVNARDDAGQTAMHYAASCGHKQLVLLLLRHKADPSLTDDDGLTPKQVAEDEQLQLMLS